MAAPPKIARRVVELIGPPAGPTSQAPAQFIFTSGKLPPAALAKTLVLYGFQGPALARPAV